MKVFPMSASKCTVCSPWKRNPISWYVHIFSLEDLLFSNLFLPRLDKSFLKLPLKLLFHKCAHLKHLHFKTMFWQCKTHWINLWREIRKGVCIHGKNFQDDDENGPLAAFADNQTNRKQLRSFAARTLCFSSLPLSLNYIYILLYFLRTCVSRHSNRGRELPKLHRTEPASQPSQYQLRI